MKRMLVFLLLGLVFGVLVVFSQAIVASGDIHGDYAEGCAITFMFSLIVSAITGPVDELQACVVPIFVGAIREQDGAAAAVLADSDRSHRGTLHRCLLVALAQSS